MSRVLAVDDDEDILRLVSYRLTAAGHQVLTATDGVAALRIIADRGLPDVAVFDMSMPEMTGLQLAERVRALPGGADTAVVFLSARVQPEDIAAGQQLGGFYLTKPFVATALLSTIERATAPRESPAVGW